ncbi:extracellular solute-binding protein [Paraburkholderia sp. ZP32-5]|uniref:extracellular solute-binding protein n=1 Tax=Paraburkholderia sp. ZP32-5 TaxID=2883245 RepID=UPI001F4133E3|nr:extracellular solute-binding protein [Paraburkholderia sp. ZP32-5]
MRSKTTMICSLFAASLLTVAQAARAQEYKGMTLQVLGVNSDINAIYMKTVGEPFEKLTGAKLVIVTGSSTGNLSKALVAKGKTPPFSVIALENLTQAQAISAGAIQKLDYSKLPNAKDLAPGAVPVAGYGPAFDFFRFGTCVNVAQYKAHDIALPKSVDDWFNPAIVGHNILPTPSNFWWSTGMQAIAEHYGIPLSDPTPLFTKLKTMKPIELYTASGDAQTQLQSGAAWLAPTSDGRCYALKLAGQPVDFFPLNLHIKGKTYLYAIGVDTFEIPSGVTGKQLELAHIFINLSLDPSAQLPVTHQFGYPPASFTGIKLAEALPEAKKANMYGDSFSFDSLYTPDAAQFLPVMNHWIELWNQTFAQ